MMRFRKKKKKTDEKEDFSNVGNVIQEGKFIRKMLHI